MERGRRQITPCLRASLRRLVGDRRAATAVEYGLILALIVLTMIGALSDFAATEIGMWTNTSTKVAASAPAP